MTSSGRQPSALAKVLVVEDDPDYRQTLMLVLERAGYEVATAATGDEGLALAAEFLPHVVITDWMLRDQKGGRQVALGLRQSRPEVKLLLLTGYPEALERLPIEPGLIDVVLQKPCHADEILGALGDLLGKSEKG